jgi:hypothetical protein
MPTTPGANPDDEIIPTAIVIKNIPFNVKRETLLDIIVRDVLPYFTLIWLTRGVGIIVNPYSLRIQLSS